VERGIESIRDRSSPYWAFYDPDKVAGDDELVEVRLNATPGKVEAFVPPPGWTVDRIQWGDTLYLRRRQRLTERDVEEMLVQMLRLAGSLGMQFFSWLHGSRVD
jgi:hypothetical protein